MSRLARLTPDTAVGASRQMLGDLVERHGQVGDMVATMAHSPSVLGGFLQLSRSMRRAKLPLDVSELVSVAVQQRQGCSRCLEAHEMAARDLGVPEEEIAAAREGRSSRPAVAAMIGLALAVYRNPSSITDAQIEHLRNLGYSDRQIADVVGVVALNILTGAFNLLTGLSTPASDEVRA
jgi:AhpD family alkylhydroperoxidase